MKKTIILPLIIITIILIAAMIFGGCNKSGNTDEKDKTDNQVASATPIPTVTPMPSVSPEQEEDKYHISGEDLDQEVVVAFREYIYEHTVSMGRFVTDQYYYYDVTGDGKPDLLKSVTHGSGIVSTGIFVYDIENKQGYQLQERGDYDYWVDSVKDGVLYIKKAYFGRMKLDAGAVGKLEFVDDELKYNGPEPDRSDLPTPVVTRKPTEAITEIPTPGVTEPPKYTDVEITGEFYKFHLPSNLLNWYEQLSIEENDEHGVTICDAYSIPKREYLRLSVVTDIDSAVKFIEDETKYTHCVFSKDHIFVWQIPAERMDLNKDLSHFDLYDLAKDMEVLKDGETNEAIDSFTKEHFKRYIELTKDDEYTWLGLYSYGIKILGGADLSDMTLYTLCDTKSAPVNRLIIRDGDEIYFAEHFEDENVERLTSMYSFDYDNNGVKEYGMIPYFTDPVDGYICNEYDHLWVAEKTEDASEYSVFDFDPIPLSYYAKAVIKLTVDPTDDHTALFSLNGEEAIRVKCGYTLDEKDYELEYLCILESDEYGSYYTKYYDKSSFTAVFRANLPVKDGEKAYDSDYAPLIFVEVAYKGNGDFEISYINIKNYGDGLEALDFSDEGYIDPTDGWDIYEKAIQDLENKAVAQGGSPEDVKVQNFRIISVNEDGTVVLRAYYDLFDIDTAGEPPSEDPEDYELDEGLVPLGTDIVMKISDDCKFVYYPKNSGWNRHIITFDDFKYLADNYYSRDYVFPLPSYDSEGVWYEYLNDFTCIYLDGVIYYMGEQYHA